MKTPAKALKRDATKLTRKQQIFADTLLDDPKLNATQAALTAYGNPRKPHPLKPSVAKVIASENLSKPNILAYMERYRDHAQARIVELTRSKREEIALKASQDILDRTVGKPITNQSNNLFTGDITITLGS